MARQAVAGWPEPALSCRMAKRSRLLEHGPINGCHLIVSEATTILVQNKPTAWQDNVYLCYIHVRMMSISLDRSGKPANAGDNRPGWPLSIHSLPVVLVEGYDCQFRRLG